MTIKTKDTPTLLTYFIADLHLSEDRQDISQCFIDFLKNEAPKAQSLYILGDLFESWVGDDDNSKLVTLIASALFSLKSLGTKIYYIHGNRDFLLGEKYAKVSGMKLLPEITLIDLYNQPVVIMHGDTLCTKDVAYQKFRTKSRSWWWQTAIKSLPLFIRRKIASNYRKRSASATAMKSQHIMDVTDSEVVSCLEHYKSQLLIHGHTHRPDVHHIEANGTTAQRVVLGDWHEQGAWLKVTPDGFTLQNKAFTPTSNK